MCMIPTNYFIVSKFYKLSQKSFNTFVKFQPNVLYISFNSVMPEWLVKFGSMYTFKLRRSQL